MCSSMYYFMNDCDLVRNYFDEINHIGNCGYESSEAMILAVSSAILAIAWRSLNFSLQAIAKIVFITVRIMTILIQFQKLAK